ncbi:MAG TPA: hypothetical protein DEH25_13330 [Chloroflexi bacterium]|nr:hypothetical protein [Chloroflexota bacterium]
MRLSEFVLRYRLGEGEWQVYPFTSPEIRIGREADNDLILDNGEVSRHHLEIHFTGDEFRVVDLGSSNGTHLDGITLISQTPTVLRPGQILTMGEFTLLLTKASEEGALVSKELLPFLLRYRFGPATWQTFPIEPGEKIFGRDPNSDFYLDDTEVSRQHARLKVAQGEIWLIDLGSTNGTKVGGVTLSPNTPYRLQLGQSFSIGNFILQVDEPARLYKASPARNAKTDVEEASVDSLPVQALNLMSRPRTTLGRGAANDIFISHPLVNRQHAALEKHGEGYRLLDLSSTHGVYVNERRLKRETDLKDWDQIRIGASVFVFAGNDLQQQIIPGLKLEVVKLNQRLSPTQNLLHEINLLILPNELVGLVGANGSGLTTLLEALSGRKPATHGQVLVNGFDLYKNYDIFRKEIGYVPCSDIVHAELTPERALDYAARLRLPADTAKKERSARISEILETLDLTAQRQVPLAKLSLAQVKRVSLGCELLTQPRLIFLEDPTKGLDSTARNDLMALLRRLADQGHTIISILPPVPNLQLCDKVIFMAAAGHLAYLGTPEDALDYFNAYRTDQERRKKLITFEDVYRIVNDDEYGTPAEWHERYLQSTSYKQVFGIDPSLADLQTLTVQPDAPPAQKLQGVEARVSGFRQFFTLAARNLKVLTREPRLLAVILGLAPILGLLDFLWGRNLYDPARGKPGNIIILWFMGALSAMLVGALSSLGEIVKETQVYRYERRINLKILPYFFSKLWLGLSLAFGQAAVLLVFRQFLVNPQIPSFNAYLAMYFTLFLTVFTGYLMGLLISALSANRQAAFTSLIVVLGLQILFAGALLPLDWIPGAQAVSFIQPARWSYEALVQTTGLGNQLAADPCWIGYDPVDRLALPESAKLDCPCLGASIFTACADFPGVLAPSFYNQTTISALTAPEPASLTDQAVWQQSREKAIRNAEAVIGSAYDQFPQVFTGTILGRWLILLLMQVVLLVLLILAQKRKDQA